MSMLLLLILGITALATSAYVVGELVTAGARERRTSIRRAATYGKLRLKTRPGNETFNERVLAPAKARLAAAALKLNPRSTVDSVSTKLLLAGLSRTLSPTGYLALKTAGGAGALLLGLLLGVSAGGAGPLVFPLAFAAAAFFAPDYLLTMKARSRNERVRAELPDALDLLAVSVESGLGFDGAIAKLTEHMDGALADEFSMTLNAMRIGESRQDALKKMAERVPAPELGAFIRAIIQADQLGISLGRILRVQAADTRLRRQAAAEEKAMKAPIKMLFPTVLFIFPAMFIVILGPAMMNILEVF
jgi:tight adherence protein C